MPAKFQPHFPVNCKCFICRNQKVFFLEGKLFGLFQKQSGCVCVWLYLKLCWNSNSFCLLLNHGDIVCLYGKKLRFVGWLVDLIL